MFDSATEANSEKFARFLQANAISSYVIPTEAHWQLGRAERNGAVLKHMITKYHEDHPIQNQEDFEQGLIHLCNAKNAMSRHAGYTPELWVLGKMKPVPGCNSNVYMDSASYMGLEESETEGNKFQEMMSRRESARLAFVRADHSAAVLKAIHARSRPDRMTFSVGDMVMYWRAGKGVEEGAWHGPAKILMTEGNNLVWISHLTRLYRCAPEHVRRLSEDEAQGISLQELQTFQLPNRTGTGVFQFRELSTQASPTTTNPRSTHNIHNEPDTIIPNPPVTDNNPDHPPPSVGQPDDEPGCQNADPSRPPTPTEEIPDPAVITPVPEETDDDLIAVDQTRDHWEVQGDTLIRHHVIPRLRMFFPTDAWKCPVDHSCLTGQRETIGTFVSGGEFQRMDAWNTEVQAHRAQPEPWTGTTKFQIQGPMNMEPCMHVVDGTKDTVSCCEAEILLTIDDFHKCLGKPYDFQEIFLASAAKKQKVEVKVKELSLEEQKMFLKAKDKELESWLSTDTVRKILRNKVPEGQLLRSRWVLSWKPLDEIEQKEVGTAKKAKARLVILGYEDPLLDSLPRDSPTLGRDSRMLALQCIASHRWSVRSFDIRTAFLRGSRQDGRILGMEPPPELRLKMKLQDSEVCELLKGAYGLFNAPLLWYCELKNALLGLGFVMSPFDPCLFTLPKKNPKKEECQIHGVLGIHVDDGIGGGDHVFNQTIATLEKRFPFGTQRQGSFTFTGIQIQQEING